MKPKTLTAHQFARLLLDGPDVPLFTTWEGQMAVANAETLRYEDHSEVGMLAILYADDAYDPDVDARVWGDLRDALPNSAVAE
jgi:hypothetical protein